jgi:hypothetical protein
MFMSRVILREVVVAQKPVVIINSAPTLMTIGPIEKVRHHVIRL